MSDAPSPLDTMTTEEIIKYLSRRFEACLFIGAANVKAETCLHIVNPGDMLLANFPTSVLAFYLRILKVADAHLAQAPLLERMRILDNLVRSLRNSADAVKRSHVQFVELARKLGFNIVPPEEAAEFE